MCGVTFLVASVRVNLLPFDGGRVGLAISINVFADPDVRQLTSFEGHGFVTQRTHGHLNWDKWIRADNDETKNSDSKPRTRLSIPL